VDTRPADDVHVELTREGVAVVEMRRPPNNFFDVDLIRTLADTYAALDADPACRAIVLCSEGKHFCAGADFGGGGTRGGTATGDLYAEAVRLFETATPVVAAVQGAAIGGGLGLACSADFRVAGPRARFAASFARLGFHHGFGLTVTLPDIVGRQHSLELLLTGRRIGGEAAAEIGLCDRLVEQDEVRSAATALAAEIAGGAPLAVTSIRQTMRGDLATRVRTSLDREGSEQDRLRRTADWAEGIRAAAERRDPTFTGR